MTSPSLGLRVSVRLTPLRVLGSAVLFAAAANGQSPSERVSAEPAVLGQVPIRSTARASAVSESAVSEPAVISELAKSGKVANRYIRAGQWWAEVMPEYDLPTPLMLKVNTESPPTEDFSTHSPSMLSIQVLGDTEDAPDSPPQRLEVKEGHLRGKFGDYELEGQFNSAGDVFQGELQIPAGTRALMARFFTGKSRFPLTAHWQDATSSPQRPRNAQYQIDGHTIHYVWVQPKLAATVEERIDLSATRQEVAQRQVRVVLIHGSPGEAGNWQSYLLNPAIQNRATVIAVDRPGWGKSEYGQLVTDFRQQARLLEPSLRIGPQGQPNSESGIPTVVVGWSLGGPIAAELAMDYPQAIQHAVLIAPAIDPERDGAQWYNQLLRIWPIGPLVGALLGQDFRLSNREMLPLKASLKQLMPRWSSLTVPITVIQGEDDGLVDPQTAVFAQHSLPQGTEVIQVPKVGHGVVYTQRAFNTVIRIVDQLRQSGT